VAVMLVGGIFAFLADSSSDVVNTFTAGKVDIEMDETKVNPDGTPDSSSTTRVTSNEYHLIPGSSYTKDPQVRVSSDSEDAYLYIVIKDELKPIEKAQTVEAQMTAAGFTKIGTTANGTKDVWKKSGTVSAGDTIQVFQTLNIADNADVSQYVDKTIELKAYAVQAANVTTDAQALGEFSITLD